MVLVGLDRRVQNDPRVVICQEIKIDQNFQDANATVNQRIRQVENGGGGGGGEVFWFQFLFWPSWLIPVILDQLLFVGQRFRCPCLSPFAPGSIPSEAKV